MQFTAEGLIIGVRRHGESSVIAELMLAKHGRTLGLVRGGRSSKLAATLQPGNTVQATWRARLADHLGNFTIELLEARAAALIVDRVRLYACQLLCDHLRLLPERDPHDRMLAVAEQILEAPVERLGPALARFELTLLDELGVGLDLGSCAVTGVTEGLTHVSPRTGRAVCLEAAAPYLDRLLVLPRFFVDEAEAAGAEDLRDAFVLTGHFLDAHVWHPRQIAAPSVREDLVTRLAAAAGD